MSFQSNFFRVSQPTGLLGRRVGIGHGVELSGVRDLGGTLDGYSQRQEQGSPGGSASDVQQDHLEVVGSGEIHHVCVDHQHLHLPGYYELVDGDRQPKWIVRNEPEPNHAVSECLSGLIADLHPGDVHSRASQNVHQQSVDGHVLVGR
ncbi:MAG: hypothetical protein AB7J40_01305 [Candidatus Altimarinota bacterium]